MLRLKRLVAAIACALAPAMAFAQTSVITSTANSVFRDFVVPGNALSGVYNPPKADVRSLFSLIDSNKLTIPPNAPFVIVPQASQNFLTLAYGNPSSLPGSSASLMPTDPANGYSGINLSIYANPGTTGIAEPPPSTAGIATSVHLSAGLSGIAVGGMFQAFTDNNWSPGTSAEAGSIGVQGTSTSTKAGVLFGANFAYNCVATPLCNGRGIEVDAISAVNWQSNYGLIFNSPNGSNGIVAGTKTVFGGNTVYDGGAIQMFAFGSGTGWPYGIIAVKYDTPSAQPIYSNGTFIRVGGFGLLNLIDARDLTIDPAGYILNTPNFKISGPGEVQSGTWHGSIIDLAHGGTNANLTASNGGILYSTASASAVLAGTGTAGLPLISGANAAPQWGAKSGNTNTFGTTSGTLTSSNCAKFDASGNLVDNGGKCATIAAGKTLAVSNTLTFTGTDGSTVNFGGGGTAAYTGGTLAQFAGTTSAQLAGVLSDETGSGAAVFGTSPTIATPTITGTATVAGYKPSADSTTAIQLFKADGTTIVWNADTTNRRIGVNRNNPTDDIDVLNSGTATFRLDGTAGDFMHFAIGGVNKLQFGIDTGATYFDYFGIINFRAGVGGATMASLTAAGAFSAVSYLAGSTAGVTCSGSPTASFASTNGIVTHC